MLRRWSFAERPEKIFIFIKILYCPAPVEALISLYAENQDSFQAQAERRLHEAGAARR
jgi:hypothetical protein